MSSRRTVRQIVTAVLLGVLVGGGLLAVTPAGAQVSSAAATSWKKIWKKNLQPLAKKTFYTKKQTKNTFATKTEVSAGDTNAAAAGAAAANSATDSKLGGYYTKAESDGKYAPYPSLIRGTYSIIGPAASAGQELATEVSFGVALASAPTVHYINKGAAPPAGCSGTVAAPNASPGHLCVFEAQDVNVTQRRLINAGGIYGQASPFGASVIINATAAGSVYVYGSWAVRPDGAVSSARTVPAPDATGPRAGD